MSRAIAGSRPEWSTLTRVVDDPLDDDHVRCELAGDFRPFLASDLLAMAVPTMVSYGILAETRRKSSKEKTLACAEH